MMAIIVMESLQGRHCPTSGVGEVGSGETAIIPLWQLVEKGLTRDLLVQQIISIPLLYTGNTLKMKVGAIRRRVHRVVRIEAEDNGLRIVLKDGTLRLSFHAPDILRMDFEHSSRFLRHSSATWIAPDDAHYLGLGQRFNRID